MNELVIFDLDGTLYKTEVASVPALKEAFSRFDIDVSKETILDQFGEPTSQIIKNLVPKKKDHLKDQIEKAITENENEMIPDRATLYGGIKDVLVSLEGNGYTLAICSNGRREYIEKVLETTSIEKYFSSIKGYTPGKTKADLIRELIEEFSAEGAVMVGDRYHDLEAAEKVGVHSVGAKYGYGGEEVEKADHVVSEPADLVPVLEKI
ncbi:MAG: HAD family hydrolase [Candidatus Thermoplasmatota archaeon]